MTKENEKLHLCHFTKRHDLISKRRDLALLLRPHDHKAEIFLLVNGKRVPGHLVTNSFSHSRAFLNEQFARPAPDQQLQEYRHHVEHELGHLSAVVVLAVGDESVTRQTDLHTARRKLDE